MDVLGPYSRSEIVFRSNDILDYRHHKDENSKIVFQWTCCFTLSGVNKFSVGHHCLKCVLVSFLRIISILQNKRKGHTTLQSESAIANVSRRWFLEFHTPSKLHFTSEQIWFKCNEIRMNPKSWPTYFQIAWKFLFLVQITKEKILWTTFFLKFTKIKKFISYDQNFDL